MKFWRDFDYSLFKHIDVKKRTNKRTYNDVIIMADTETSKKPQLPGVERFDNHVVAWSIAFRAFNQNLVTLWGQSPDDFCECVSRTLSALGGQESYFYFHNLPYDYFFLRRFLFRSFGFPESELNIKPLQPLTIRFANGLILKDSLALAQKSLEKWANDLDVETKKAVGSWDYDRLRNQSDTLTPEELLYIEHDVKAGVECIDATMQALGKNISTIPYTGTGIPRGEVRAIGKKNRAYDLFKRQSPEDYNMQLIYENVFHGGYVHNNRYYEGETVYGVECQDIASSYPFHACAYKFPVERFWKLKQTASIEKILKNAEDYAQIFKVRFIGLDLKDLKYPMPLLSNFKCQRAYNSVCDNGKIMRAEILEIWLTEIDLEIVVKIYKWIKAEILECYVSAKDYLPRWFTDYVYERFRQKTKLKGASKVNYQIEKGKLNAVAYGMIAQKPCKPFIEENFDTGEYYVNEDFDPVKEYEKHLNNRNNFICYHHAIYVTAYAQRSLFELAECVDFENGGVHLYSDTDSVYATKFNAERLKAYNDKRINMLRERGYEPVEFNGREYYLGVAEFDGSYSEFRGLHAKCYCVRDAKSGELKITVAGVPKKGVISLNNSIDEFKTFFCFPGVVSGKLQHKHCYVPNIYTDENGNLTGDSIDLSPCDYIIGDANIPRDIDEEEIEVIDYEE